MWSLLPKWARIAIVCLFAFFALPVLYNFVQAFKKTPAITLVVFFLLLGATPVLWPLLPKWARVAATVTLVVIALPASYFLGGALGKIPEIALGVFFLILGATPFVMKGVSQKLQTMEGDSLANVQSIIWARDTITEDGLKKWKAYKQQHHSWMGDLGNEYHRTGRAFIWFSVMLAAFWFWFLGSVQFPAWNLREDSPHFVYEKLDLRHFVFVYSEDDTGFVLWEYRSTLHELASLAIRFSPLALFVVVWALIYKLFGQRAKILKEVFLPPSPLFGGRRWDLLLHDSSDE